MGIAENQHSGVWPEEIEKSHEKSVKMSGPCAEDGPPQAPEWRHLVPAAHLTTLFLQAALILRFRSCLQTPECSTCATAVGRPVYPAGTGRPVFWEGV